MSNDLRLLKLRQLDRQLNVWRVAANSTPVPKLGWVRTLRKALGIGSRRLALRLNARQPWTIQLEKAEVSGTVTLASLRKAAEALDCDFVYAFVPRDPLVKMIQEQVGKVAATELKKVGHSMALENQRPSKAVEARQLRALRRDLLAGPWRRLWR